VNVVVDKQFLVGLESTKTAVHTSVWVISPTPDNMQEFIDSLGLDSTVVSVKEMHVRCIRSDIITKAFPVLVRTA
jgi:hypothetical protein